MKQNKWRLIFYILLGLLSFSFTVRELLQQAPHPSIIETAIKEGQFQKYSIPAGSNFAPDSAHTYAPQIEGKVPVGNWHSALFMYEGRALKLTLDCFSTAPLSGVRVFTIIWYISWIIFITNFIFIYIITIKKQLPWYACTSIPIAALTAPFMFPATIDCIFLTILQASLTIVFIYPAFTTKFSKYSVLIILFFLLFHVANYRKNAILLIPIFSIVLIGCLRKEHLISNIIKCTFVGLSGIAAIFLCSFSFSLLFPVKKMYPILPMLESDLRIAAILRGEQATMRQELSKIGYHTDHPFKDSLSAYYAGGKVDKEQINNLYFREWCEHTETMLAAKFIQVTEFYTGGHLPGFIQNALQIRYPALNENEASMRFLLGLKKTYWMTRMLLLGMCFFITCRLSVRKFMGVFKTRTEEMCWLSASIATVYALSYVVVTPTADVRYLAPSIIIGFPAITLYIYLWRNSKRQQCTSTDHSAQ